MTRVILAAIVLPALLAPTRPLRAQEVQPRPPEVTDSAVARGAELFHRSGGCFGCHGIEGSGTPDGPALRQGVWLHGADSYSAIVSRVTHGIPQNRSLRNTPMPMRGMSELTDDQVRAVAAYVWWLSHPGNGGGRPKD